MAVVNEAKNEEGGLELFDGFCHEEVFALII